MPCEKNQYVHRKLRKIGMLGNDNNVIMSGEAYILFFYFYSPSISWKKK